MQACVIRAECAAMREPAVWNENPELRARAEIEKRPKLNGHNPEPLLCHAPEPHTLASIPPRTWAYGRYLLFGSASALGGMDGSGKGAIAVVVALSFIIGKALLGERVWRTGPVAIITYEDDETEWKRRIAAACLHYGPKHGFTYEDVIGSFHFISKPDSRVCLAAASIRGNVMFPDGDAIIAQLKQIAAALLIVDPFNHAHALEDGNNNVMIARVAGELTRIANESGTAVLVLHHLRKGATGDPDDLMGAVALRATFRSVRIIARMIAEQAKQLSLPPQQAWRYTRISGSKENYAPPPELATWYKLESVELGNGADIYCDGDNVQVATLWNAPDTFDGVLLSNIAEIFAAVRAGPAPGLRWSADVRSGNEWIGTKIAQFTGKSLAEAKPIVRTWIRNTVLVEDTYDHPRQRKPKPCISVNEIKAAEILGPLYFQQEIDQ
jgi:hypothetical protein